MVTLQGDPGPPGERGPAGYPVSNTSNSYYLQLENTMNTTEQQNITLTDNNISEFL